MVEGAESEGKDRPNKQAERPHETTDRPEADELRVGYAASSAAARELFDLEFLGRLEYLRIVSRRAFAGLQSAQRRGLRAGSGLEFAEHRPYAVGDDFRYMDWAAYGRLDRLLLRLFQQDEDLSIALLIDVSNSMLTGDPPKVDFVRRLAAALSYVGLSNLDRIRLSAFAGGEVAALRTRRGRGQIFPILDFLAAAPLGGPTDLVRAARQLEQGSTGRGLVVVLSDFLGTSAAAGPPDYEEGLSRLRHAGHEVWAMMIEAPQEVRPPWQGEVSLVDAESGREARLRLTPEAVAGYLERREQFVAGFNRWTTERGLAHIVARSDTAIDELVLNVFRRGGFIK